MSIGLWDFSLAFYAKPQVASQCVQLQDDHGVNVNLLCWSLWLELGHIELTHEKLAEAIAVIERWDKHYVQALRELRRNLKAEYLPLTQESAKPMVAVREQIKSAELLAEKCEQEWLERLTGQWQEHTHAKDVVVGTNLEFYLGYLHISPAIISHAKYVLL